MAASPARCFALATAFEAYPEWTSDVKQVTVLDRDAAGRGTRVEYHVAGLGRRVRYLLDYDFSDAPRAFSWSLVEGDLLRAARRPLRVRADRRRHPRRLHAAGRPGRADAGPPEAAGVGHDHGERAARPEAGRRSRRGGRNGRRRRRGAGHQRRRAHAAACDTEPSTPPSTLHPETVPFEDAGTEARPLPPPSILESVLTELLGAVPEVKDHVLEAADALLDAAKALVDAADRVVRQQRGEE